MLINKIWSSAICIPRLKEYVKEVIFRPVTRLWPGVKDIFTKKEFSDEEKKNQPFFTDFPSFFRLRSAASSNSVVWHRALS